MTSTNTIDADAALPSDFNGVAVCYLCLDGEVNENSQPLRRDCACRGTDAGFVHLSCLTDYAASKSEQARTMKEYNKPWEMCPHCHQFYQNELRIDIATRFVSFVRRTDPDHTQLQVESLYVKLRALIDMFDRLQPVQKREAGVTANVLLSLIDRMKNDASLPRRYSQKEANLFGVHGEIAFVEGTVESARRAVAHFEKQIEVYKAIGDDEGIAMAKDHIAAAKARIEGVNSYEELKELQEAYEMRVAKHGEEKESTISVGKNFAILLRNANRGDEARQLLTKLLATSKQVLGPNHNLTKSIESICDV